MTVLTRELSDLAGQWIVKTSVVSFLLSKAPKQIVAANPLRWSIDFVAPFQIIGGTGVLIVSPSLTDSNNSNGYVLSSGNLSLSFVYRSHGGLIQRDWWLVNLANGIAGNLYIVETLLQQ